MRSPIRGGLRLLGAVGLIAVMAPLSQVLAQTSGRDYSRCVQTCNETRRGCDDRCTADCYAMFPKDVAGRNACKASCHDTCISESQDCKLVCKAQKNGETLEEP